MDPKRIAPLLAVAAAGLVGLLFGCGELNHDPVITSLTATPDTTVRPGAVIVLAVSATDVDDDSLAFSWSATAGTLSATTGESVEWTAPDSATAGTVTVACSDGQGGEDSAFKAVNSRAWLEFDMDGYTPDSTHLANPGLTEAEFTFELDGDPFPPGSVADSVFITTDFVPDTLALEGFDVWVVSPTGTASLIYDGNNMQQLNVDYMRLLDFAGESAEGTWKLRILRTYQGLEGYVDECALNVFYHY